ncbi:MAG TPA: ABC transporter permease [Dongiaceae bacterium]
MSATIATSDGPSRLESWLREAWLPIAFVIALFGIWEACVHVFDIQPYMLPAPSAFFYQLGFRFERIWDYTLVTGSETLAGFLLAVVIGVPLSLVVAFSWVLRRTLYPLAVTLEMIPKIAFAPIMVSWLGFAFSGKVVIVFMVCFFPILLNGILAFTSLSEELLRFARSTGAGALATFFRVRLPAALPQLFVGIKGAAVNATVGATVSEWVGGDAGLGYYIQIASGELRMDIAFAIMIMLAALGLALFFAVVAVERALIPWHISQRRIAGAGI